MPTAIVSDIHANLEALDAVCRTCDDRRVDTWICLGDIVGYGADPGPCLRRARALTDEVVLGNHDAAAVGLLDLIHFNEFARRAARWTGEQLTDRERAYLSGLPLSLESAGARFVHSDPDRPGDWGYVLNQEDIRRAFASTGAPLCFIGHTHRSFVAVQHDGEAGTVVGGGRVHLEEGRRYLVNVGSVGQPRDRDPRAGVLIWEEASHTVELVRVPYDVATAQRKIVAAGLPAYLAQRLAHGK